MTNPLNYPINPAIDWPLDVNQIRRGSISNTFGTVRHNADGSIRPHQGWDFYAAAGTRLFAIADGKVVGIKTTGDYGNTIICSFMLGKRKYYVAYSHLSEINVTVGQNILQGMRLGLTGNTGNAKGMTGLNQHLHLEIRLVIWPGRGLENRISPLEVFEFCPLNGPITRKGFSK